MEQVCSARLDCCWLLWWECSRFRGWWCSGPKKRLQPQLRLSQQLKDVTVLAFSKSALTNCNQRNCLRHAWSGRPRQSAVCLISQDAFSLSTFSLERKGGRVIICSVFKHYAFQCYIGLLFHTIGGGKRIVMVVKQRKAGCKRKWNDENSSLLEKLMIAKRWDYIGTWKNCESKLNHLDSRLTLWKTNHRDQTPRFEHFPNFSFIKYKTETMTLSNHKIHDKNHNLNTNS